MSNYCECHINIDCEWCRITVQNKRYREVIKTIEKYANDCIDVGVEMNPHLVIDDIKALEESK